MTCYKTIHIPCKLANVLKFRRAPGSLTLWALRKRERRETDRQLKRRKRKTDRQTETDRGERQANRGGSNKLGVI